MSASRYVVLDTCVISGALKTSPSPLLVKAALREPLISFVTLGELSAWPEIYGWGTKKRAALSSWTSHLPVLHSTVRVAEVWGHLHAASQRAGLPRPQNDMWIAAVCLAYDVPLATFNLKDFQYFVDHHGLALFTL